MNFWQSLFNVFQPIVQPIIQVFQPYFAPIIQPIYNFFQPVFQPIYSFFQPVIQPMVEAVQNWFSPSTPSPPVGDASWQRAMTPEQLRAMRAAEAERERQHQGIQAFDEQHGNNTGNMVYGPALPPEPDAATSGNAQVPVAQLAEQPEFTGDEPEPLLDLSTQARLTNFANFMLSDFDEMIHSPQTVIRDLIALASGGQILPEELGENQSFNFTPPLHNMTSVSSGEFDLLAYVDQQTSSIPNPEFNLLDYAPPPERLPVTTVQFLQETRGDPETGQFMTDDPVAMASELRANVIQQLETDFPNLDQSLLAGNGIYEILQFAVTEYSQMYQQSRHLDNRIFDGRLIMAASGIQPPEEIEPKLRWAQDLLGTFFRLPAAYSDPNTLMQVIGAESDNEARQFFIEQLGGINDFTLDPRWADMSTLDLGRTWYGELRSAPREWGNTYRDPVEMEHWRQRYEGTYAPPDYSLVLLVASAFLDPIDAAISGIAAIQSALKGDPYGTAINAFFAYSPFHNRWMAGDEFYYSSDDKSLLSGNSSIANQGRPYHYEPGYWLNIPENQHLRERLPDWLDLSGNRVLPDGSPLYPTQVDASHFLAQEARTLRTELRISRSAAENLAFAHIDVNNIDDTSRVAVSGSKHFDGTVDLSTTPQFHTYFVGEPGAMRDAGLDAEAKLLEDIAPAITPDSSGTIILYTEKRPCVSCGGPLGEEGVIRQFRDHITRVGADVILIVVYTRG